MISGRAPARGLALGLGVLLGLGACGGSSSVCGNGVPESGEQCDDGNERDDDACSNACLAQQTLDAQVMWTLTGMEFPGFSETCSGVGATQIHLEVTGPIAVTQDVDCNFSQFIFTALEPGSYHVKGTLLDLASQPVTKGEAAADFTISGADAMVPLDFPFSDFSRADYVGSWFYKLTWGGASACSTAVPPVTMTSIRLERNGTALTTGEGTVVDGATPAACFEGQFAPAINKVPWGPAMLTVTGFDAGGTPRFRGTYPTFVGAGLSNPVLAYDVQSLAPDAGLPDAGVATSDAGP